MRQLERFLGKVDTSGECWLWMGSLKPNGYGQFGLTQKRRSAYAHRVSYEHFVGPIPKGFELDHLCFVRNCVRPAHLRVVTHAENCLRGDGLAAKNARKTHCPQGHSYALYAAIGKDGSRKCRVCHRERQRIYNRRVRARHGPGAS